MKLKTLMLVKSVICLLFGVAFVVLPIQVMGLYDIALSSDGALVARLLGAAFIVLGIWLALQRNVTDPTAQRAVATSSVIGDTIGAVVIALALINGTGNILGWVNVAIYALLAIGFAYVLLAQPEGRLAV